MNRTSMLDEMLDEVLDEVPHGGTRPAFILGKDKPGMKLQCLEQCGWVDCLNAGKVVKSPVDLNKLPPGDYRLV